MYLYIVSAGHIYFSNIYFINNLATLSLLKCENRITRIGIVKEYYVVIEITGTITWQNTKGNPFNIKWYMTENSSKAHKLCNKKVNN